MTNDYINGGPARDVAEREKGVHTAEKQRAAVTKDGRGRRSGGYDKAMV